MSDVTNDLDLLQQRQRASEQQALQAQDAAVEQATVETPSYQGYTDFDIRVQALNFAMNKYGTNATDDNVIKAAGEFEKYLRDGLSDDDVSDS